MQAKRSANASCYAVLLSDSVIQHRVLSRELDDLQSGAIRKATVAPGEGGASPAEGDLVRPRTAPLLPIARRLRPTPPCREPLDAPRPVRATWSPQRSQSGTPGARRPQVYVHVAVREGERTLATTRADEGGPGVPRARAGQGPPRAARLGARAAGCPPARPPAAGHTPVLCLSAGQRTWTLQETHNVLFGARACTRLHGIIMQAPAEQAASMHACKQGSAHPIACAAQR